MICPASEAIATACVACSREISTSRDRIATGPRGGVTMSELAEGREFSANCSGGDASTQRRAIAPDDIVIRGCSDGHLSVHIAQIASNIPHVDPTLSGFRRRLGAAGRDAGPERRADRRHQPDAWRAHRPDGGRRRQCRGGDPARRGGGRALVDRRLCSRCTSTRSASSVRPISCSSASRPCGRRASHRSRRRSRPSARSRAASRSRSPIQRR